MASKTCKRSICILTLSIFSVVHAFMDIEELQSINYGINILKEPIVIPEVSFSPAFLSETVIVHVEFESAASGSRGHRNLPPSPPP